MSHTTRFSQAGVDHYHQHGCVLLRNFLNDGGLSRAHADIEKITPDWRYTVDYDLPRPDNWQEKWQLETNTRFPFPPSVLNEVTFHTGGG